MPWGQMLQGMGSSASDAYGAGSNAIGGVTNYIANKRRLDAENRAYGTAQNTIDQYAQQINALFDPYTQQGQAALSDMMQTAKSYPTTQQQYTPDMVNKWIDPNINYQMDQVNRQMEAQQAGTGDYLSGQGALSRLNAVRDIAQTGWQNARDFGYKQYSDILNNNRNDLLNRFNMMNAINQQGYNAVGQQAQNMAGQGYDTANLQLQQGFNRANRATLKPQLIGNLGQNYMQMQSQMNQNAADMFGGMNIGNIGGY